MSTFEDNTEAFDLVPYARIAAHALWCHCDGCKDCHVALDSAEFEACERPTGQYPAWVTEQRASP